MTITSLELDFNHYARKTANYGGPAVLLLVPSLIAILAGSLMLTINGINVNHIVLHAFTPACPALIISIFLFYRARPYALEKKRIRKEWIDEVIKALRAKDLKDLDASKKAEITAQNKEIKKVLPQTSLFCMSINNNQQNFLRDLKSKLKEQDPKDPLISILDKLLKDIINPPTEN